MDGPDSSRKRPLDEDSEGGVSKKSNQGSFDSVHLKILVPFVAAGAIIGKGGETISQIQKQYGASIKMSKSRDYYPGTTERVCLVVGKTDAVLSVHQFISKCIREKPDPNPRPSDVDGKVNHERHNEVKLLVPNSTAGMIIGKSGNHIKDIKEQSGAFIQISQKCKEMNLPERCVTVAGDEDQCDKAVELILLTIVDDPQSSSCPNISYLDYQGPIASANPTGSPFSVGNRMDHGHEGGGGGQMMQPQHQMMHPQANMGGNQQMMGHGNQGMAGGHGGGSVFNNLGNGMHNLTLNSGGGGASGGMQGMQPQGGGGGAMSAVDTMRATLRGSGYTEQAIEEIIQAVMTLANYGLFGFSVNLSGLGLQGPPQGMGMLGNLANIMNNHQGHGQAHGGPMGGGNMMKHEANPQVFGPVGSTTTTKAGGDTGEGGLSFYANAGGMNGQRMGNSGESWGPGFNQGGGNGGNTFSGMNQNSFGLGTGMGEEMGQNDDQSNQKEMEVGEHIVGAIIGQGGKGIIEIQSYTGANIQISKKGVFAPGTRNRVVTITGPPRAIHQAEYVIRQRVDHEEKVRSRGGRQ